MAQEFIRSNAELGGMREDIRHVKDEVQGVNNDVQKAGKEYLSRCQHTLKLRGVRERAAKARVPHNCPPQLAIATANAQPATRALLAPPPQDPDCACARVRRSFAGRGANAPVHGTGPTLTNPEIKADLLTPPPPPSPLRIGRCFLL